MKQEQWGATPWRDAISPQPANQPVHHRGWWGWGEVRGGGHEWPDCFILLRDHISIRPFEIFQVAKWSTLGASEQCITWNEDFYLRVEYRLGKASSVLPPAIIKPLINEMAGASLRIFPQRCHLKYPIWKGRVGEESSSRDKCYLISTVPGSQRCISTQDFHSRKYWIAASIHIKSIWALLISLIINQWDVARVDPSIKVQKLHVYRALLAIAVDK